VHAPSQEKSDDSKNSFYEELDQVSDYFIMRHTTIMWGDLNKKFGREDVLKPTIRNESLHQGSNNNGVKTVNFATTTILVVKNTMFPCRNFQKYTWTFPDGKNHN
jgi:hypothetical protein